jgi:hypothetical protein
MVYKITLSPRSEALLWTEVWADSHCTCLARERHIGVGGVRHRALEREQLFQKVDVSTRDVISFSRWRMMFEALSRVSEL